MDPKNPDLEIERLERLLIERDEDIRQLRLALEVLSPVDPSSGMLNRNGVIDAIQDALDWLMRRSDPFAVLVVQIPALEELYAKRAEDHRRLHQHLEVSLAVALRRVDKVGHLDYMSYAAVLREFKTSGSPDFLDRIDALYESEPTLPTGRAIEPAYTLAIIKPDPAHKGGSILERVEAIRKKATTKTPLIVEL